MYNCSMVNVATNTVETVILDNSALMRKLTELGKTDAVLKVNGEIPMGTKEHEEASIHARLTSYVSKGFEKEGTTFVPFLATASDARKATSLWLDKSIYAEIGKWIMCGLQTKDMTIAINKYMAYMGLMASATRSFSSVYGHKIDIRRVCVVKDYTIEVSGKVDLVDGVNVTYDVERNISICAFDGAGLIMPKLVNYKCSTLRGPWIKVLAIPCNFKKFAREHEIKTIPDIYGNEIKVEDVDLILTESAFKMGSQYKSWKQYTDSFIELGHEISVCVEEHRPAKKAMPYQQLQTLVAGNKDDAINFAAFAKREVVKMTKPEEAAKLLGGNLAIAAKYYPDLIRDQYCADRIQEAYTAKRNKMIGGKVPGFGYNAFLAPDVVAMMEAIFGLEVKGKLEAGECYCSNCHIGEVDITRNPHFDHAHVIMNNIERPNEYFVGPTMYVNIKDLLTIRIRADYDGDHVWYSQNAKLIDLVKRTNEIVTGRVIDWTAPKAAKGPVTMSAVKGFVMNLTQGSQIGRYADAMTKMWAYRYDRFVCDWLTYAGNVLIDAAKHGNANVKVPDSVKDTFKRLLPGFCEYAKSNDARPIGSEYWFDKVEHSDSFADMYSDAIKANIHEMLNIEGVDEMFFNPSVLMIDAHRSMSGLTGLCRTGKLNAETRKYENTGLFQQIAFRHAIEWGNLSKVSGNITKKASWDEIRGEAALEEIKAFCEAHESTIEAAYDIITRWVFNTKMSNGYAVAMKTAYWRIFGKMAIEVIKKNRKIENTEFGIECAELGIEDDDDLFVTD